MRECARSLAVAKQSNCPSSRWQFAVRHALQRENMSYVNIGANVGSNVNEFLNLHGAAWNVSARLWHEHAGTGCGACLACHARAHQAPAGGAARVHVVAVEMTSAVFSRLQAVFRTFGVPGVALHAAGGDALRTVFEPPIPQAGFEGAVVAEAGTPVPMLTVDSIAVMLPSPHTDVVDVLSIDTEGHDALVLQGAARGIERRAFRVIEFEYHGKGRWLTTSLNATVAALLRHDYTCFWQGNRGRLSRFRPACNYEFRAWSNLVCAHEARIVAVLRALEAR